MVITITEYQFIDEFRKIRPDNFSREGLEILFEYLTQIEDDTGQQIEFDPIGFCGDYREMTAREVCEEYSISVDKHEGGEDEDCYNEPARKFLESEGLLIGSTGTTFLICNV